MNLVDQTQWYCTKCHDHFEMAFPPVCPRCNEKQIATWYLEAFGRRYGDQRAIEEADKQRTYNHKRYERRIVRFSGKLAQLLEDNGIAQPEHKDIVRHVCVWEDKPKPLLRFFRIYNFWEPRVGWQLARDQARWEMRRPVVAMRDAGMTLQQIGDHIGVGRERVRQLYSMATRYKTVSPVERWLQSSGDIAALHNKLVAAEKRALKRRESWSPMWMHDVELAA